MKIVGHLHFFIYIWEFNTNFIESLCVQHGTGHNNTNKHTKKKKKKPLSSPYLPSTRRDRQLIIMRELWVLVRASIESQHTTVQKAQKSLPEKLTFMLSSWKLNLTNWNWVWLRHKMQGKEGRVLRDNAHRKLAEGELNREQVRKGPWDIKNVEISSGGTGKFFKFQVREWINTKTRFTFIQFKDVSTARLQAKKLLWWEVIVAWTREGKLASR